MPAKCRGPEPLSADLSVRNPSHRRAHLLGFGLLLLLGLSGVHPALHAYGDDEPASGWHAFSSLSILAPAARPPKVSSATPGPGAETAVEFRAGSFDLHFDPSRTDAPVVVRLPSKVDGTAKRAPRRFLERWVELGFVVVDVHPRGLPQHTAIDGAHDVSRVLAWLQLHAKRYGGDPEAMTLLGLGHGAHLAALVSSEPRYLRSAGVEFTRLARVAVVGATTMTGPSPRLGPDEAWFGDAGFAEVAPYRRVQLGSIHPDLLYAPLRFIDPPDLAPERDTAARVTLETDGPGIWVRRHREVGTRVQSLDPVEIRGTIGGGIELRLSNIADPWSAQLIAFCDGEQPTPEPAFRRNELEEGFEYVIPRVHTPAWNREAPIPPSPLFVRRILRCGACVLDVAKGELRFRVAEPVDDALPQRIDEVARACGLIPYWEELERRSLERGTPGKLMSHAAGSILGHAPVLLEWSESEEEGVPGVDLQVYLTRRSPIDGVGLSPQPPAAGEIVHLRLTRRGLNFQLNVVKRERYDSSLDPPRPEPNPTVLGLGNGTRVRLDRLTNHCRANDRFTVRLIADDHRGHARVLALDSDEAYGTVAWKEVFLGVPGLLLFREDQGEGALVFYFVGDPPEEGRR
ncbi:MAG: hypothetical protein AAF488_04165 [Planctomycetota bacterium]